MKYLVDNPSILSTLIRNQFPQFVRNESPLFIDFLTSYYESQEIKYHPLDLATNLIDYYNISYYSPDKLIKSTFLSGDGNGCLSDTATVIGVASTSGFPDKGYIQIDDEIIFYQSKTNTEFVDCIRGTSALVLQNLPDSEIVLVSSSPAKHRVGSEVINIAYAYANEFVRRIKSEIAVELPEIISDLNFVQFLKNIKSFYSSKGSLNSHRILFKLLFNDKKIKLNLLPGGSGAEIKINNYNGTLLYEGFGPVLVSGGSNYDDRKDGSVLVNPPIIRVIGSGTGSSSGGSIQYNSAQIEVTDIVDGEITEISVIDEGKNYVGSITAIVRERIFGEDQLVQNADGTAIGRVEYWDAESNELYLYDVIGTFKPNEEIIGIGGESPRRFISPVEIVTGTFDGRNLIRFTKEGVNILPAEQDIEFSRDYTLKLSESKTIRKRVIRLQKISGDTLFDRDRILLIQNEDRIFGISKVSIECDNIVKISDNIYEADISSESDFSRIYAPSTTVTKTSVTVEDGNTFTISTDDCSRFPISNGQILVDSKIIFYQSRSFNQFFGCSFEDEPNYPIQIPEKSEVISYGRRRYNCPPWQSGESIEVGEYRHYNNLVFISVAAGTSGSTPPNSKSKGIIDGPGGLYCNSVLWDYVDDLNYSYYLMDNDGEFKFVVLGLPGELIIENGGSLYTQYLYNIVQVNSSNQSFYRLFDEENSIKISEYFAYNINRTGQTYGDVVNDSDYDNILVGIQAQHEFGNHIYISSTCVPSWNTSEEFVSQKLLARVSKDAFLPSPIFPSGTPTSKAIGISLGGIEFNSYKGNVIESGNLNRIVIADGGLYEAPVNQDTQEFDYVKYPKIIIDDQYTYENTVSNTPIGISASFLSIDFTLLVQNGISANNSPLEVDGFTSAPYIIVQNNNTRLTQNLTNSNVNISTGVLTISNFTNILTGSAVTLSNSTLVSPFVNGQTYYLRAVTSNTFTIHNTESDAVLNLNPISFSNPNQPATFSFRLTTEILNPNNFEDAQFDISYNELTGSIDNIIIRNPGAGYMKLPTLILAGGGKAAEQILPYVAQTGEPIIRMGGPIISNSNYYKENPYDVDYIGPGLPFESSPTAIITSGFGASASVTTANGSISSVVLIDGGENYYTKPIVIVDGIGEGAIIDTEILNGRIIGFEIINAGSGYDSNTKIRIETFGRDSVLSTRLNTWTFNLVKTLESTIDTRGGYVYDPSDDMNSGQRQITYSSVFPESELDSEYFLLHPRKNANFENIYKAQQRINTSNTYHSAIVGISYDGIPIYGNRGLNAQSTGLKNLTSSYSLKSSRIGGPSTVTFPLGTFVEDYEYIAGSGDLDEHNGRFCVTPEFPEGRYCYFLTSTFPYIIGNTYASSPDFYNNKRCRTNDMIPAAFVRVNEIETSKFSRNEFYPNEYRNYSKSYLYGKTLSKGGVDSVLIENSGFGYRFGDRLIVDNSGTSGSGFAGFVSRLTGKDIQFTNLNSGYLSVATEDDHNLQIGDQIYFDYKKSDDTIDVFLHGSNAGPLSNIVRSAENVSVNSDLEFRDKRFYTIELNKKRNYVLQIPNASYSAYLDPTKINSIIIPKVTGQNATEIHISPDSLPGTFYLFINSYIYEINITNQLADSGRNYSVSEIISDTEFLVEVDDEVQYFDRSDLIYSTKSRTAVGGISEITISNKGYNYLVLPSITGIDSSNGYGASVQCHSTTIGSIKNLHYLNPGDGVTTNKNVNYQIDIPLSGKILDNYELYEIDVISGGTNYSDSARILVDGTVGSGSYEIVKSTSGSIQKINIINSQKNMSGLPVLSIQDLTGTGAVLSPRIRRIEIPVGLTLMKDPADTNSKIDVISYDPNNSVIVFNQNNTIINDGDLLYSLDTNLYGRIEKINKPYVYAKVSSYVEILPTVEDSNNLSNAMKKLTDSNVYQDWAYILASSRNTNEWMESVLRSTHPSGHKVFGRNRIERRKKFSKSESLLSPRISFNVNLSRELNVDLTEAPCPLQSLEIPDSSNFEIGDYILGLYSYAIGKLVSKNDNVLTLEIITEQRFNVGDILVNLGNTISIVDENTDRNLVFLSGLMQEPEYTYEFIPIDGINDDINNIDTIIPEFPVGPSDIVYNIKTTSPYTLLDSFVLDANNDRYILTRNGSVFSANDPEEYIISIGGAVQNPNDYTIIGNVFDMETTIDYDQTRVFAIHHQNLRKLSFSGPSSGTTFNVFPTPIDPCNLLIFNCSVLQSVANSDYTLTGNTIQFADTVNLSDIFGWYFDEPVSCRIITDLDSSDRIVQSIEECSTLVLRKIVAISSGIDGSTEEIPILNSQDIASNPPTITVNSPTGSGAILIPHVSNGGIVKITVENGGSGYDPLLTTLTITGGNGSGAIAIPNVNGSGTITSILVTDPGEEFDTFKAYILDETNSNVDLEIFEYTVIDGNILKGCTRGSGSESYSSGTKIYFDNV